MGSAHADRVTSVGDRSFVGPRRRRNFVLDLRPPVTNFVAHQAQALQVLDQQGFVLVEARQLGVLRHPRLPAQDAKVDFVADIDQAPTGDLLLACGEESVPWSMDVDELRVLECSQEGQKPRTRLSSHVSQVSLVRDDAEGLVLIRSSSSRPCGHVVVLPMSHLRREAPSMADFAVAGVSLQLSETHAVLCRGALWWIDRHNGVPLPSAAE